MVRFVCGEGFGKEAAPGAHKITETRLMEQSCVAASEMKVNMTKQSTEQSLASRARIEVPETFKPPGAFISMNREFITRSTGRLLGLYASRDDSTTSKTHPNEQAGSLHQITKTVN